MSFSFERDGVTFHVHTEVGEGSTRVLVEEQRQPSPDLEPCDEADHG